MTCSKIFSGDLTELTDEIIQYLRNDISTLYSCILVNRLWCQEKDKEKLQDYGINKNLSPLNTLFNYLSFIKYLNTQNIISTIKLWVRDSSTREIGNQSNQLTLQSHPKYDLLKFIYESLFKIFIEREINLNTFDIFIFSNDDCDYFNIAFKLILQNQSFIHNIKNLNFNICPTHINITTIIPYLKSINTISSLSYEFHGCRYDQYLNIIHLPHKSNYRNLNYLFTSFKNSNILNTLKIITFRNISFNNIFAFNEIFEQLNVLESIHIIDCYSLNSFIERILNITKPFKLKTLFMNNELLDIDSLQLLLQKSGNYLENISFGPLINESKQQSLELIISYCMKIKVLELFGFDDQNIYSLFNFIENIGQNLNHLAIHQISDSSNNFEISLIVLQNLGQILPFKLEYLDLNLIIENANDFKIFLKNSQNTFINRLCIKIIIIRESGNDILHYIKDYIMRKKRVKYLGFKVNNNELFVLKDEVKEFELYNIKVQIYSSLSTDFVYILKKNVLVTNVFIIKS
ncbi:hypothetical protein GLOIN_2v1881404 [Rhizophagus irregularis DAOM 181602=DAOM 197198]|nr:hypothetical protein GLOIN_2v1881404 [Rhizophagus irregularis DAOM 181602=DAOM 197198]